VHHACQIDQLKFFAAISFVRLITCPVAFNVLHIIDTLMYMQEALLKSLPKLVALLSSSTEG